MKRLNFKQVVNWLSELYFGFFTGCVFGAYSLVFFQYRAVVLGLSASDAMLCGAYVIGQFLALVFFVPLVSLFFRFFITRRSCTLTGEPE